MLPFKIERLILNGDKIDVHVEDADGYCAVLGIDSGMFMEHMFNNDPDIDVRNAWHCLKNYSHDYNEDVAEYIQDNDSLLNQFTAELTHIRLTDPDRQQQLVNAKGMEGRLYENEISLSDGSKFTIYTDMDRRALYAAVDNWSARTDTYTAESLCAYINSKGTHTACTLAQWQERNNIDNHTEQGI